MIDPDGNQISFSFEYEKDADGNDVVDKDGNKNLTGITMTVTGRVLNISNKDVDKDDAISEISSKIKSSFSGTSEDGIKFNTVVNLTEAKSIDDVNESDHVFALADIDTKNIGRLFGQDEFGNNKVEVTGASNQPGGRVAILDVDYFRGLYDTSIGSTGERTAAHELGHLLSLGHKGGVFNLMRSGGFGTNLTESQISTIIKNIEYDGDRINRGSNFVIIPIVGKKKLNTGQATPLIKN